MPLDSVLAAALPPLSVLETLTCDAILDQHGATVMKTVKALGSDMTTACKGSQVAELICSGRLISATLAA